jgi:hypothetical protein
VADLDLGFRGRVRRDESPLRGLAVRTGLEHKAERVVEAEDSLMSVGSGGLDSGPLDSSPGATVRKAISVDHDERLSDQRSLKVEDAGRPKDDEIDRQAAEVVGGDRAAGAADRDDAEEQASRQRAAPIRTDGELIRALDAVGRVGPGLACHTAVIDQLTRLPEPRNGLDGRQKEP